MSHPSLICAGVVSALAMALLSACGGGRPAKTTDPHAGHAGSTTATSPIPYPLTTFLVTDNALDSMGGEQRLVHEGRELKFCCPPCIATFKRDPAKYLNKLAAP